MTETSSASDEGVCRWCGRLHGYQCPEVKALEFHPDGSVKRVEFKTAADYQPITLAPYPTTFPVISSTWGGGHFY